MRMQVRSGLRQRRLCLGVSRNSLNLVSLGLQPLLDCSPRLSVVEALGHQTPSMNDFEYNDSFFFHQMDDSVWADDPFSDYGIAELRHNPTGIRHLRCILRQLSCSASHSPDFVGPLLLDVPNMVEQAYRARRESTSSASDIPPASRMESISSQTSSSSTSSPSACSFSPQGALWTSSFSSSSWSSTAGWTSTAAAFHRWVMTMRRPSWSSLPMPSARFARNSLTGKRHLLMADCLIRGKKVDVEGKPYLRFRFLGTSARADVKNSPRVEGYRCGFRGALPSRGFFPRIIASWIRQYARVYILVPSMSSTTHATLIVHPTTSRC